MHSADQYAFPAGSSTIRSASFTRLFLHLAVISLGTTVMCKQSRHFWWATPSCWVTMLAAAGGGDHKKQPSPLWPLSNHPSSSNVTRSPLTSSHQDRIHGARVGEHSSAERCKGDKVDYQRPCHGSLGEISS
jgi:hypothetical protein